MSKKDTRTIRYPLRIYDDELLDYIAELAQSGHFKSKNDVINKSIEFGVPFLYKELFGKKISATGTALPGGLNKESEQIILRKLQEINLTVDDIFIVLNLIEYLVTTIYNVELAKLSKINISDDEVRSGLLSNLPENLQQIKSEVVNRHTRKKEKH